MKKFKLISSICMLILSVGCLAFGVYSATTASFSMSGNIGFTATGIYADLKCNTYIDSSTEFDSETTRVDEHCFTAKNYSSLTERSDEFVKIGGEGNFANACWDLSEITLDSENAYIKLEIVVTNRTNGRYLKIEPQNLPVSNESWVVETVESLNMKKIAPDKTGTLLIIMFPSNFSMSLQDENSIDLSNIIIDVQEQKDDSVAEYTIEKNYNEILAYNYSITFDEELTISGEFDSLEDKSEALFEHAMELGYAPLIVRIVENAGSLSLTGTTRSIELSIEEHAELPESDKWICVFGSLSVNEELTSFKVYIVTINNVDPYDYILDLDSIDVSYEAEGWKRAELTAGQTAQEYAVANLGYADLTEAEQAFGGRVGVMFNGFNDPIHADADGFVSTLSGTGYMYLPIALFGVNQNKFYTVEYTMMMTQRHIDILYYSPLSTINKTISLGTINLGEKHDGDIVEINIGFSRTILSISPERLEKSVVRVTEDGNRVLTSEGSAYILL